MYGHREAWITFSGVWKHKLSCYGDTAKGVYIFPIDLSTSDWGTVWQKKEILLTHMLVVNKYVTGFSRLATDQFSQESPSWEWSLLQKNQVRYWKKFGLGNMELLLAWKISFSPAKSNVSSFKLNSMLLSGKRKLFPAVLDTNSSYSKLVLMYFPGPNSLHFRARGALNHLMRESDIDGLNSSLRHPQTLLSWGALGFIKANPCFYETFVNASDYCKIIIKYL